MSPRPQAPDKEEYEDYYRAYFGNDADYYLDKLEKYQAGTKITFNIAAFFFGIFWMLYRRMYRQGLLVMVALTAESYLLGIVIQQYGISDSNAKLLNNISTIAWSVLVGFLGNWLYLRQAQAKVAQALEEEDSEQEAVNRLNAQGSITLIPHIIVAGLILLLVLLYQANLIK
ncbi:DUF2628 domain-containing protein [Rufibacter glacialis]|uniref:DUF2628 domain-containing protein n=1 Tax=Rufibacter glacialis TaxID=1259555 RepID=A0A5M8QR80_9BACT|nr:DUF2628 domain-containing protein [Rufibacter glacialis]KAA6437768.1 DUF2628 domain-containing protein [Rufibacter glacialis]GGK56446.1 hypothetical protein GCM10011405_00720 [Rufibacter glacialis]